MPGLTNEIEQFLLSLLEEEGEEIQIGRNELASHFNCAPSQINYVLSTRFTPYNGYYIESRRGGSGYIRIVRLEQNESSCIHEVIDHEIQDELTADKARHILQALVRQEILTEREGKLLALALDNRALSSVPYNQRNRLRADILKNALVLFLK